MENEKPITEKQKQLANKIYTILVKAKDYVTKEQICAKLGWEYNLTNDRKVRDTINIIKHHKPIVATPDKKGYLAPIYAYQIEEVLHQWRYIDKLQAEHEETKKPLIKFYEKAQKSVDKNEIIVL